MLPLHFVLLAILISEAEKGEITLEVYRCEGVWKRIRSITTSAFSDCAMTVSGSENGSKCEGEENEIGKVDERSDDEENHDERGGDNRGCFSFPRHESNFSEKMRDGLCRQRHIGRDLYHENEIDEGDSYLFRLCSSDQPPQKRIS